MENESLYREVFVKSIGKVGVPGQLSGADVGQNKSFFFLYWIYILVNMHLFELHELIY